MLEQYPNEVKLVLKNFPLPNHEYAKDAAIAALAAHRQGKFWEMHDLIFANFKQLTEKKFNDFATELSLDKDQFSRDRSDKKLMDKVSSDLLDGQRAGVRGTPTIFVNGKLLKQRSLDGFKRVIDQELSKLKKL